MQTSSLLAVATVVFFTAFAPLALRAAEDGVALAIIYDTSGSMKEKMADAEGGFRSRFQFILQQKILLEDEEPPKTH